MNRVQEPSEINVDELDAFVSEAAKVGLRSHAERNAFLLSRHMAYDTEANSGPTADPFSTSYALRVVDQWKRVSGRSDYTVTLEYDTNIVAEKRQLGHLYPFSSKDTRFIAEYWIGVYAALKLLIDAPNRSVVEYGIGWGNTTCAMLQSGYEVTAVDIDEKWLRLVELRAEQLLVRSSLRTHHGEFGDLPHDNIQYGAILFYECFHHALAHDDVLARIVQRLADGGLIILAAEAIYPNYPVEWGVRQDGHSLWAIRRFGWMELGFSEDYIIRLMRRHKLSLNKQECSEAGAFGVTYVARLDNSGIPLGHSMLTSSESGFYEAEHSPSISTRFTNGDAILEVPCGIRSFTLELKNWLNLPVFCEILVGNLVHWRGLVAAGELTEITLPGRLDGYYQVFRIRSDSHCPKDLGINDDPRVLGIALGRLQLRKA